ncbi:MAG: hypothetical protein WAX66_02515 [Patescibacteria group bacterium]
MKIAEKLEYKIYIDTSKRDEKEVKLVKENEGVVDVVGVKGGKIDVIQSIEDLLLENNLKINDISMFVPNLGPGSFTGLKMGVTVSNVLNWILGRKSLKELDYPEYGGEPNISKPKS